MSSNVDWSDVFGLWGRGLRPETIAKNFGISPSEFQMIIEAEKAKRPSLDEINPEDLVREHLIRMDAVIEELAMLASGMKGSGRVRPIQVRYDAMKHQFEVLQRVGLLPRDLQQIGDEVDLRRFVRELLETLRKRGGVPEETILATAQSFGPKNAGNGVEK